MSPEQKAPWKCLAEESSFRYRQQKAELERQQMLESVTSAVQQQLAEEDELRFYRYEESTDSKGTCNTRI